MTKIRGVVPKLHHAISQYIEFGGRRPKRIITTAAVRAEILAYEKVNRRFEGVLMVGGARVEVDDRVPRGTFYLFAEDNS